MNQEMIVDLLEKLKSGEIPELTISKEDFLSFRVELVKRPDFKHFRGIAKHDGITTYTYLEEARS